MPVHANFFFSFLSGKLTQNYNIMDFETWLKYKIIMISFHCGCNFYAYITWVINFHLYRPHAITRHIHVIIVANWKVNHLQFIFSMISTGQIETTTNTLSREKRTFKNIIDLFIQILLLSCLQHNWFKKNFCVVWLIHRHLEFNSNYCIITWF